MVSEESNLFEDHVCWQNRGDREGTPWQNERHLFVAQNNYRYPFSFFKHLVGILWKYTVQLTLPSPDGATKNGGFSLKA